MDVPRQLINLDKTLALERLGGDEQLLGEIAGLFLSDYPSLMAQIRDAVARRDAGALHHAAHTLKGSVANFCAQEPFESAYKLERLGRSADLSGAEETLAALELQLRVLEPLLVALQHGAPSQL
jgi:two-component system, sensor histidine kinase and response regulator